MTIHQASAHLKARAEPEAPSMLRMLPCRDGLMVFFPHDFYLGGALEKYGEYSRIEFDMLARYVKAGDVVIEVGANMGCHTVPLAKLVGSSGCLVVFEPQRIIYQMLCGNLAVNGLWNVIAERAGVGDKLGVAYLPQVDYTRPGNFGAVSLSSQESGESTPLVSLDQYCANIKRCDLIKIDVEGMELDVLKGATGIIGKFCPVLYVENDRSDKSEALCKFIRDELQYELYWHTPRLFNPENFRGDPMNIYGDVVSINMLCFPKESGVIPDGLQKVGTESGQLQ